MEKVEEIMTWLVCVCAVINEMWPCVAVVLELNDNQRDPAGDVPQNGDTNPEDQASVTPFEINLKDKRFVWNFVLVAAVSQKSVILFSFFLI